ncbi:hypothetical protein ACLQ2P_41835 [Actinomadura citrea]|uniref:hypothetical protein n=1 Tax=Actinomadura citrea TaxID=46158 RepID=UPI003CE5334F
MSNHRKDKKVLKTDIPAVAAFVAELDKAIKARTSENQLYLAAGVGHSKLVRYLDGRDVPDPRVLQHYILGPLGNFGTPLGEGELVRLTELHREACKAQEPKKPTEADQITFLEEDLKRARALRARLQERLNSSFAKNIADREYADRLEQIVADLRGQVDQLSTEQQQLSSELGSVKQAFDESAHQNRREQAAYREQIAELREAVTGQLNTLQHMQATIDYHDGQMRYLQDKVRYLEGHVTELEARNAEDRKLFMRLAVHLQDTPFLTALRQERDELQLRHERGEQTISQLTATVARLTEELERVTIERDFLSSAMTTAPIELPSGTSAAPPGGIEATSPATKKTSAKKGSEAAANYWALMASLDKPPLPWSITDAGNGL